MSNEKLGRPTKERLAVLRNQVSYLLWYGKLETTLAKAKSVSSAAERILTLAIKTYDDTVKAVKNITDSKGVKVSTEVINDGVKKLNARRKMMKFLYDLQEQRLEKENLVKFKERTKDINHPLIEKVFNLYAPKYAERAKEKGSFGGYTRVSKLGMRRGDASQMAIVELV